MGRTATFRPKAFAQIPYHVVVEPQRPGAEIESLQQG